ncbi:MAG: flagellar hook-length control protein FliK, partial [Proteobacteria bacterium]|nr:flagellar hook-length control protein FliK [Pseudomonadota bacterium]
MEKTAIASPAPQGTHEARAARGSGNKLAGAQDAAQAGAQGGGFALLLAALGDGGEEPGAVVGLLDVVNATVSDAGEDPLKPEPVQPDAGALAPWMLGLQPAVAPVPGAGTVTQGESGVLLSAPVAAPGMAGRNGQGLVAAVQDGLLRLAPGS